MHKECQSFGILLIIGVMKGKTSSYTKQSNKRWKKDFLRKYKKKTVPHTHSKKNFRSLIKST